MTKDDETTPRLPSHPLGRRPGKEPRRDDAPTELAVPNEFRVGHEVNTGVHELAEDELLARAKRIQHVTEGSLVQNLESGARMLRTERAVGVIKGDVDALKVDIKGVRDAQGKLDKAQAEHASAISGLDTVVKARFDAQNQLLAPLVQLATSNAIAGHAVIKAQVEIGAAQETAQIEVGAAKQIDVIDEARARRERRNKILTILSALVALLLGALRLHGCLTE